MGQFWTVRLALGVMFEVLLVSEAGAADCSLVDCEMDLRLTSDNLSCCKNWLHCRTTEETCRDWDYQGRPINNQLRCCPGLAGQGFILSPEYCICREGTAEEYSAPTTASSNHHVTSPTETTSSAQTWCTCHDEGECGDQGVISEDGRKVNVAYGKPARMSSRQTTISRGACMAVNGKTDTNLQPRDNPNCVHTNLNDLGPWWEVDLGQNYTVSNVTIYRRTDDTREITMRRFEGGRVLVDGRLCYAFPNDFLNNQSIYDLTCSTPLVGRYIKFQRPTQPFNNDKQHITMCEVQVWVCRNNTYGVNCEQCGNCLQSAACDVINGTCHACEARFKPPFCKVLEECPSFRLKDPLSGHTYTIPDTPVGVTFISPHLCMSNGKPYVELQCARDSVYGAQWSEFKPNQGCNFTRAAQSSSTNTLQAIAVSDINRTTQAQTVRDTVQVTSGSVTFAPVDVVYIADILQLVVSVGELTPELGESLLELVDKVTDLSNTTLQTANTMGNATNRILKAVEDLGQQLLLNDSPNVRLVTESNALEVWNLTAVTGDLIIGLELRVGGKAPVDTLQAEDLESVFESNVPPYNDTDAAILLPAEFLQDVKRRHAGKDIRLIMNVYADTSLLKIGRLHPSPSSSSTNRWPQAVLNSKVISASITVDGVPLTNLRGYDVTLIFLPINALPLEDRPQNTTCVFWDFSGSRGQGAWSSDGCRYNNTVEGRDVCVCDHLTNFAVLLDVYGQENLPEEQQFALSIITIVGLSLSIAGLSITVLSFIFIKKLRQGRPQQTLFNMALAMLCSWVVFLMGFSRVESGLGCLVVAVLLHYFILASFLWMLMEGVLQYLLFVKILGNSFSNYLVKTALAAWGLPLIPVILVLAIDPDLYLGGDRYCWMALTPFYYAFLAPVALVMLVNIVVYVMVVVNICRRSNISSSSSSSNRVVGIRASVACFVVLGLGWVLAFLAVEDARVVFQYLFTITASLQGFLIFLIFTARDPTVRAFWWQWLCCRRPADKHSSMLQLHRPSASTGSQEGALTR